MEVVIWIVLDSFGVINEGGEYHDAQNQEENEEDQLFGAGLESVYENFQTS